MEHSNFPNLDIRTLIVLLTESEISRDTLFTLLARECNVPVEKLINAVTIKPQEDAPTEKAGRIRWSDEKNKDLIVRWNRGDRPSSIAEAFGCSTSVIYQRLSVLRKTHPEIKSRVSHNPFVRNSQVLMLDKTA
jgi:hypothetical protein